MSNLGDRVLGQWETEWFYPGVIVSSQAGTIEVQFDDGDRAQLRPDQIRPLILQVGSRVYARWQGGSAYYGGHISAIHGNAISIDYDDGDKETTTVGMVRIDAGDLP